MRSYKENFIVKWHEIDGARELRPFAFVNMAQETANVHSAMLKFGYKELIALNQTWVLSRMKIRYIKPPVWGDKVSMETWHKGKQGLFWLRDFVLCNQTGETVAAATSSWVIMNINTRRIERKTIFDVSNDIIDLAYDRDAIELPCEKIAAKSNLEFVRYHNVMYSDIDFNLHANNAKYVEWIMDSISLDYFKRYKFRELQINYISEAKFGDEIKISKSESAVNDVDNGNGLIIYYEGSRDGALVFQGQLFLSI
ncbi:MAG: thioesterase [Bacteroidales bacterium]